MNIKNTLISTLITGLIIVSCDYKMNAQENKNHINASITQDLASNMHGGIRTGQAHLGLISLDFKLNTESLNLWNNGNFFIQVQNTYGHTPTESLVGDIQVFSNIENGTYTYLYQAWYKHEFNNFTMLAGKHDLNAEFFASEYGSAYINSSFGIMPVASLNVPVSIFPMTTLGFVSTYQFNNNLAIKGGIYNGRPGEISKTNFGTNLNLNKNNGLFYISEFHLTDLIPEKPGTYKLGMFHHSGEFNTLNEDESVVKGASGIYFIADQSIINESGNPEQGLGAMLQMGYSPYKSSINDFYMAYGINYTGLIPGRNNDVMGFAVAHASANDLLLQKNPTKYKTCETAFELTYSYQAFSNLSIQPNFQYILHPGMESQSKNAFVGTLRIQWNYN